MRLTVNPGLLNNQGVALVVALLLFSLRHISTIKATGNNINSVEYSGYAGTQTIARKLDMLTVEDYQKQIAEGSRAASWDLKGSTAG